MRLPPGRSEQALAHARVGRAERHAGVGTLAYAPGRGVAGEGSNHLRAAAREPLQRAAADLAAGDQSNREIAQPLFVTPKTVEYHLRNVYRKLGIESRQHLARALEA